MYKIILKTLPLMFVAGCMQTLQQVNRDLAGINQALAQPSQRQAPGLALMSDAQHAQIDMALSVKSRDQTLVQAIAEAAPVIKNFVKTNACITGYNGSALNAYAAPGKSYSTFGYDGAPMQLMKYHNKASCASVLRFHGWSMPARNALRFEVVYSADDSGETIKNVHELVQQPTGEWLFSR